MKAITIAREQLEKLVSQGLSDRQIAERFGCTHETVRKRRLRFGLSSGHPAGRSREAATRKAEGAT